MNNNRTFEGTLEKINDQLDEKISGLEIDKHQIDIALSEGLRIREKQEMILNNLFFFLVAMSVFTVIGYIIFIGYSSVVLILQVVMIVLVPFAIPFAIKKQLKGGVL